MIKVSIYLDKRDKKPQVKFRITNNGRTTLVSTGIFIAPGDWDERRFRDKRNNANNTRIFELTGKIDAYLTECTRDEKKPDTGQIKALIQGNKSDDSDFLTFYDKFTDQKTGRTREIYAATGKKLRLYTTSLSFESITPKWLRDFDGWMASDSPSPNARAIHLRNIRAAFNAAIDEDMTDLYPFRKFKITYQPTRKRSLTADQLRHIIFDDCQFPRERDMFVLTFLLWGINMVDLARLTMASVVNGRIEYRRAKTGRLYSVRIEPEAQAIIDKYHREGDDKLISFLGAYKNYKNYIFRIDERLKKMYDKDISTYWARHTFATMLAELDTPIDTISMALGHSYGSKVTQVYINPDLKKADDAVRKMLDFVYNINKV